MAEYLDFYYLIDSRDSEIIYKFFEDYSFVKREVAVNYPVPQFSDHPSDIFYRDTDLLKYLDKHPNSDYAIYWDNLTEHSDIKQCTAGYTNDGKMIIGVTLVGIDFESPECTELFQKFKSYFRSMYGCVTSNFPPPANSIEFIEFVEKYS